MKKLIEIKDKMIYYCVLFFPVIDIITSIMTYNNVNLSLGMVVKSLIMGYILIMSFLDRKVRKFSKLILASFLVYLIFNVANNFNYIYPKINIEYIKLLIKFSYFILFIVFINNFAVKEKLKIEILKTPIKIILISFLLSVITGTAMPSYSLLNKIGVCGWFYSANELGGLLTLLYPISIFLFFHDKNGKKYEYVYVLIHAIALLSLGTKVGLFGCLIVTGMYFLYRLVFIKKYSYKNGLILMFILSCLIFIFWQDLPTIKNTYEKYSNLIEENNPSKNNQSNLDEQISDDVANDKNVVDEIIYSGRQNFLNEIKEFEKSSNNNISIKKYTNRLFGSVYLKNNNVFLSERDFHDVFYFFGIVGLFFMILVIVYSTYQIIIEILKNIFKLKIFLILCSLFLVCGIAYISGHTLLSPMISFYVAVVINLLIDSTKKNQASKKEILISTVHLDYGGIEKTLINLLNNIDYSKYNITLFTLLNSGGLREDVPPCVKIITPYNMLFNKIINSKKIVNKIIKHILFNKYTSFMYTLNKKFDTSIDYSGYYDFITNYTEHSNANQKIIWVHSQPSKIINKKNIKKYDFFDKIIFVSNDAKKDMLKIRPDNDRKYEVIWNVVSKPKCLNEKIVWNKNKVKLLSVGRLCEAKRFDRMLEICKKLNDYDFNYELKIIGDGPLKKELINYSKKLKLDKEVEFCGSKYNIGDYMKKANLLLMTSDYEGLPTILIESLSYGLSYIATSVVGINEISKKIAPKNSYVLVEKDVEKFATAIINFDYKNRFIFDLEKYNKKNISDLEKIL